MKNSILVMFGGTSPEHEVSVITGLQVVENIDQDRYEVYPVYVGKDGSFKYLKNLSTRKDFKTAKQISATFGRDLSGGYIEFEGFRSTKIYPYSAYLAFHGGEGEGGAMQGMLEVLGIPYTSTTKEGSVITMNKQLTKDQVKQYGITTVSSINLRSVDIKENSEAEVNKILRQIHLPVIVKPVHLGSSIGIHVAKTEIELEKALLESSFIDSEILIEEYLKDFVEYNCAVRLINGKVETSEIERPKSQDEILSFADKYQRGGKKSGGSGMASLHRELPAKISDELKSEIQEAAKKAFIACRCKGMVRIDFMRTADNTLYLTEINPIPGSMAFYLWEASGISFKLQITDLIEQSKLDFENTKSKNLDYSTDIIERFVQN